MIGVETGDQTRGTDTRPLSLTVALVLLVFLGISALGGGVAMTFGIGGESLLPSEWLEDIPVIDSWVVPGLVLGIGFGAGSLVVAYGLVRRPRWAWLGWLERLTGQHWSWSATIVIGAGHVVWIGLELVYLPAVTWLQAVYGPLGVALVLLPLLASARRHLLLGTAA